MSVKLSIMIGAAHKNKKCRGLSLIEVMVCSCVVAILFLALSGAFSSNLMSISKSQKMIQGSVFLETTLESLEAQSFDGLLALNGNRFFDRATANASTYAVDLDVFFSGVDLLQMRATLVELNTNQEVAHIGCLRSQR